MINGLADNIVQCPPFVKGQSRKIEQMSHSCPIKNGKLDKKRTHPTLFFCADDCDVLVLEEIAVAELTRRRQT